MSITLILALVFLIVSFVMAAVFNQWTNPLLWVGWAFSMLYIVGPIIGNRVIG